jgi:hypothetical protein
MAISERFAAINLVNGLVAVIAVDANAFWSERIFSRVVYGPPAKPQNFPQLILSLPIFSAAKSQFFASKPQ